MGVEPYQKVNSTVCDTLALATAAWAVSTVLAAVVAMWWSAKD